MRCTCQSHRAGRKKMWYKSQRSAGQRFCLSMALNIQSVSGSCFFLLLWPPRNPCLSNQIKIESKFSIAPVGHGGHVPLLGLPPPFFYSGRQPPFFNLRPCPAQPTPPQIHSPALEARLLCSPPFRSAVFRFGFWFLEGFWWIFLHLSWCVFCFLCVVVEQHNFVSVPMEAPIAYMMNCPRSFLI